MKRTVLLILLLFVIVFVCGCTDTAEVDPTPSAQEETEDDSGPFDVETYDIKTSHAVLKYPVKWQASVTTKEEGNSVIFCAAVGEHEDIILFTMEFGESEGYRLGSMNGTDIFIIESDTQLDDSWSEEEKQTVYSMQEDVNVILKNLEETSGFVYGS